MTFDFLPPQAYTKETLLKAYNWLQSQSDQIKELATTPDQLVSLFLKSTRLGQDSLQRYTNSTVSTFTNTTAPIMATQQPQPGDQTSINQIGDSPSLKSFKSELKNLAGMMGDLEKPLATAQQSPAQANYQNGQQHSHQTNYQQSNSHSSQQTQQAGSQNTQQQTHYQSPPSGYQAPIPPYQGPLGTQSAAQLPPPVNAYVSSALNFDEMTQILIREVKNELNLSSDSEALRMLVKIGYQKVRSLYK